MPSRPDENPADAGRPEASEALVVRPGIVIPRSEFEFTYMRSSGPGGQNVNKVNTKARLRWPVTRTTSLPEAVRQRFLQRHRTRVTSDGDLVVSSQRYRDQAKNVLDCLEKVRELVLAVADPPARRKKTKPSRASQARRVADKRRRSQSKQLRRTPGAE